MEGQPPFAHEDPNLAVHIELQFTAGHVLMGTDAPESMGFKLNYGNNMYIKLEPDTKNETKILCEKLAYGGSIEMDLQDMFRGGYFGSCRDKFGVN